MTRLISLAAALAGSLMLLSATAGHAQGAGYYAAVPVKTPAKTSMIIGGAMWKLRDGALVADRSPSRGIVLCQQVAQRAGALSSFSVNGTAFDAATLESCNARAK